MTTSPERGRQLSTMEFNPCPECHELAPKGAATCPSCGGALGESATEGPTPTPSGGSVDSADPTAPLMPSLPTEVGAQARALEEELKSKPGAKALYLKLAQLYEEAGRRDRAVATLQRLLQIDPGNTYVKHRLDLLARPLAEGARLQAAAALPVTRIATQAAPTRSRRRWPFVAGGVVLTVAMALGAKAIFFPGTRRIVALREGARAPKWSPRGDHIAFLSDRGGHSSLSVYDMRTRAIREVATMGAGVPGMFAWSSDGQKLAYVGRAEEEGLGGEAVFVADIGSGAASRVGAGTNPSWSPDGSSVAFACNQTGPVGLPGEEEGIDLPSLTQALCLASLVGGSQRQISLPAPVRTLAFSPDGARVVLALEAWDPEIVPSEQAPPEHPDGELVALADGAIAGRPTNVLEGQRGLARELEARAYDKRPGGVGPGVPPAMTDLFAMNADGSGLVQLTSDHRSALFTWSPDARILLVYTLPGGDGAEIVSVRSNGTDRQSHFKIPTEATDASAIAMSPDLGRVVFPARVKEAHELVANLMTGETAVDLFVMESRRAGMRRLANKHPFKQRFALSPDGTQIVYEVRDPASGRTELWLMRL